MKQSQLFGRLHKITHMNPNHNAANAEPRAWMLFTLCSFLALSGCREQTPSTNLKADGTSSPVSNILPEWYEGGWRAFGRVDDELIQMTFKGERIIFDLAHGGGKEKLEFRYNLVPLSAEEVMALARTLTSYKQGARLPSHILAVTNGGDVKVNYAWIMPALYPDYSVKDPDDRIIFGFRIPQRSSPRDALDDYLLSSSDDLDRSTLQRVK